MARCEICEKGQIRGCIELALTVVRLVDVRTENGNPT